MALPPTTVWEINAAATGGANVNGGGFDSAKIGVGTDYSQQTGSQYNDTNLAATSATTGAPVITSASHNFVTADEGNIINITAGTNWTVGRYMIVSTAANAATLDRACASVASPTLGTFRVGGALSLGSSDDAIFETFVAGNIAYVKSGTYTLGGTVTIAKAGTATNQIVVQGYQASRTDKPVGANAPTFVCGSVTFSTGVSWSWNNINFSGTGTSVVQSAANCYYMYVGFLNTSTTVDRVALNISSAADNFVYRCDAQSYRGRAIARASGTTVVDSCYIHDSDIGIRGANNSSYIYTNNIFRNFVTAAVVETTSAVNQIISRNTFVGCNQTATAISITNGSVCQKIYGNVFYNFSKGVDNGTTTATGTIDDYNDYYSNGTDVTAWPKGPNDIATTPGYTAISDVTGTNGTTSGSVITSSGKDFTALGVVAGRDFIYIVSGTGITAGIYGITVVGTTTLTLDIAPGTSATADKVYQIFVGASFTPGTNLIGTGVPGVFPGGYTTGYMDIGAVQKQYPAISGMLYVPNLEGT